MDTGHLPFCVRNTKLVLFWTFWDESCVKNQVICNIAGEIWKSTYIFNITQLPERCEIITVAQFAFDRIEGHQILESDKGTITSLVEANKTVYTRIGFVYEDDWPTIFDPPDAGVFQKDFFEPLINFLNASKVNGILIYCEYIYDITIIDFAVKLSNFVSAVKNKTDNLIVGLIISGSYYENFPNNSLFDFSITNEVLDLYVINWSALNLCDNDTVKYGLSPITSNISDMVTIEQVNGGVTNSSMDKSKIHAMIEMLPVIPKNLVPKNPGCITTYSIYCSSTNPTNSSQWCTNPSKLSYDQGAYAKQYYVGIVLELLDTEDYEGFCECGKFPVSNLIIDGWTASPFKTCPKLDHNLTDFN
ncbi:uncharacterized protein LOC111032321 [Myzus persicae]|uniref:uncharacterized protein LOC111032321 n=1 Tax=Myzus persicae TaxID=13164 RepID=UPI000B9354EA|nr:uncharacterized protein LOC111032321 [Myzus persicae]